MAVPMQVSILKLLFIGVVKLIRAHNLDRRYAEIKDEYLFHLDAIMQSGTVYNGDYTSKIEHKLQLLSGRKHALLTSSCSIALQMSMYATNIKPGDEVIITAYGCPISETFVHLVNATPVFCEVNQDCAMDTSILEDLITERTRAIVATGLYGDMHDHKTIKTLCDNYNLLYLNDAAQSVFAKQDNIESLQTGDIVCMSLAENKPLPSLASGGAILTDNTDYYQKFIYLRNHGKPQYNTTVPYTHFGVRGAPDEDLAAQMLCTISRVDAWQKKRHTIADYYDKEFYRLGIETRKHTNDWNTHKYVVLFKNKFIAQHKLRELGIETEAQYPDPLPQQGHYPNTESFVKRSLSIPINAHMTDEEIEIVIDKVEQVWKS